jgi:hypothetical protein
MPLKRIAILLWVAVAVLAGAFFLTSDGSDYREYPAATVATPKVAVVDMPVASRTELAAPVATSAAPATPSVPALSLSGVSDLLASAGKATAPLGLPAKPSAEAPKREEVPAAAAKDASVANDSDLRLPKSWRTASTVSSTEVEAAVKDADMTQETAQAFRAACNHDHGLKFDSAGKPLYACAMKIQVGPDTTGITSTPSYPLAQTFLLHSRPTATRKIYLDFDGHTTSGTPWNASWRGGADFTTPAFSNDASPAFSDAEKAIVQEAFRRVAEHFAPWNVDVTTEDPGVEGLRKTNGADLSYGIRVVIGPDVNDTGAGGIAYLNSFDDSIDTPCFVFTGLTSNAAYVAGVTSHEVGHTVSLVHQGQSPGTGEYFSGHGAGALSWSPIMGNGLRPVNQWAKGEYSNATSTQDNLVAIANVTSGIPLLADDHGDTMASATLAPGLSLTAGGSIRSRTDVDMIKINAGRGQLVITPKVSMFAPNLRLQIKVLNATGAELGTYVGNGTAGRMAPSAITLNLLTDGVHYIRLDGIGNGDGFLEGYSDYGSIGYYSLTASWQDPVNKPPVAVTTGTAPTTYDYQAQPGQVVNFTGLLSTDPDGIITNYSWNFNDVYPSSANTALAAHRYKAPGVYRPVLTVTDDRGATGSAVVTVTVTGPVLPARCSLATISSSFVRVNSVSDAATATIEVQDQYGNPLRNAVVAVKVSGLASADRILVRTDVFGRVSLSSPNFRRGARGTVRFDVSSVASTTHPYVAADNDCPAFVLVTR